MEMPQKMRKNKGKKEMPPKNEKMFGTVLKKDLPIIAKAMRDGHETAGEMLAQIPDLVNKKEKDIQQAIDYLTESFPDQVARTKKGKQPVERSEDDEPLPTIPQKRVLEQGHFYFFKFIYLCSKLPIQTEKMVANSANKVVRTTETVVDKALLPTVFEHEGELFVLWWNFSHMIITLKSLQRTSVIAQIKIPAPAPKDLEEVAKDLPQISFTQRECEIEVFFPNTPVVTAVKKCIKTINFFGFSALIDKGGDSSSF